MCQTSCVNGRHLKNMISIKISRHILVCYYLWNVLTYLVSRKSVESAYSINSPKVDVFLQKSYAGFLLVKVTGQLDNWTTPGDYHARQNRKPMKQQDLLSSMTIGQDFPGKASHCNTFFLSRSVKFNSGRRPNIITKDAKGKGKTHVKKLLAPRIFACSGVSPDAEIVECVWPNQEPLSLSARLFFFFWQNGTISFFFGPVFLLFFTQGLFSAFDFSIIARVKSFHVGILSST